MEEESWPEPVVTSYESLEDIARAVDERDGIMTMIMYVVRDAHGAERLGRNVRENISRRLASLGVSHQPKELPDNQMSYVRLYKASSPVGELIGAARRVGTKYDEILRKAADGDASETLAKIRELVCE